MACSPWRSFEGLVKRPPSLISTNVVAMWLWNRLNMTRRTQTPGGLPTRRLSAKASGFSRPPLCVLTESCASWLFPYRGARSRYDDASFWLGSFMLVQKISTRSSASLPSHSLESLTVDNNGSPVPQNTGNIIGVLSEPISRHDSLENRLRVRQRTQSLDSRSHRSRVRRTSSSQSWKIRVLINASVLVPCI